MLHLDGGRHHFRSFSSEILNADVVEELRRLDGV
jgi:uncharacterized membrane protein YtjA (UPF0391 family)